MMATLKRGWIKKVIDGVSTKVFPITHVKSIYYNYTQNKTLADKLNDIDTEIESTKNKVGNISVTKESVTDALGYTPYTPNEIDNKFSALETNIDWKEAVDTYDDISTAYPNPEDGWTVNVKDTDYTYRYNGTEWVPISANAIPKATNSVDGLMSKEDYTKVQNLSENMTNHVNDTNNPHSLTKEQIGLGNVDNTSDLDKPISTAMQSALDSIVGKIGTIDISSVANTITGAIVALSEASGGNHNHTSLSDVTSIKFAKSNSNYGVAEITPGSNTALSQNILNCPSLFPNASDNYLGMLSNPWYMVASKTLTMVTSTEGYTATLTAETYSNHNNITVAKIIAGCTISPSSTESFTLGDKGNSWKQVYSSELQLFTGTDPYYGSLKGAYESGKGIRIITSASFVPYGSGQTLGTTSEYWSAIYCSRMSNSSETSVIRLLSTGIAMTGDIYPYATAQSNGKLNNPWMFGYFSNFYFVPSGQTEKYATMYGLVENSVVNIYTDSAIIPTSAYSTTTTLGSSSKQWYGVYTSRIYSSGESYGFLFSDGVMVKGNFYPYTSNNYTLGTSSYLFSGIYASNVYTKAFETDITSDSSVPALLPPATLNSSYSSRAQVGTQDKPFNRFYASEAYRFTNGMWWNGISFAESESVSYGSSGEATSTGKTLIIGESPLQLLVSTSVASFTGINGAYFSNGSYSGSDEKIKTFTNDVSDDLSMLVKLFDIIKLRSFKYRYKPDSIIIGVNAEELESDMYSVGLDPSKYGILQIEYDKHLSRGDTEEDDKFYPKFISVSYERLATLAIAKIQDMEKTHVDRLNSLEQRLLELEQKG